MTTQKQQISPVWVSKDLGPEAPVFVLRKGRYYQSWWYLHFASCEDCPTPDGLNILVLIWRMNNEPTVWHATHITYRCGQGGCSTGMGTHAHYEFDAPSGPQAEALIKEHVIDSLHGYVETAQARTLRPRVWHIGGGIGRIWKLVEEGNAPSWLNLRRQPLTKAAALRSVKAAARDRDHPILLTDDDLTVHWVNSALCSLCGRERSTIVGRALLEVFEEADIDEATCYKLMQAARQEDTSHIGFNTRTYAGERLRIEALTTLVWPGEPGIHAFVFTTYDETDGHSQRLLDELRRIEMAARE